MKSLWAFDLIYYLAQPKNLMGCFQRFEMEFNADMQE